MNTLSKQNKVLIAVAVLVVVGLLFWWGRSAPKKNVEKEVELPKIEMQSAEVSSSDTDLNLGNQTYAIDEASITLKDGVATQKVASSSATMTTKLLDGTAYADVDGDGKKDAVVLLRNEAGGTGIFYYAALVSSNNGSPKVSKAVFLGDRIRIHEITVHNGLVMIDIRERGVDSSLVGVPDVPKALLYEIVGTELAVK
jgi:hypothetical protein